MFKFSKNSICAKKLCVLVVVFLVFICVNAGAFTVSFVVAETGVNQDNGEFHHSILWENALLDVFFEAGFIVSNDQMLRLPARPTGDIIRLIDVDEFRFSGIDYLIITQLDYTDDLGLPQNISLFVYRISPLTNVFRTVVEQRPRNEINDIRSIARGLVPFLR